MFYRVPWVAASVGVSDRGGGPAGWGGAASALAKTWTGQWWKLGGGGTVWDSMVYDPKTDLLYIGVGNGGPWDRNIRSPGAVPASAIPLRDHGSSWMLSKNRRSAKAGAAARELSL